MSSAVPNPNTPLAFLPPTIADQLEVSRYLYMATLGAFLWDILTNLGQDYQLIKKGFNISLFAYFASRVCTLAYILTNTVFQVAPVDFCQALQVAIGWCYFAALASTSFLFFLRIRAVFHQNQWIVAFFLLLWLTNAGMGVVVPFEIRGGHIGPTKLCINTVVHTLSVSTLIVSAVHDTFVFFAISIRILAYSSLTGDGGFRSWMRAVLQGKGLPALSRSILQGGQQYYLMTIGGNILVAVLILTPSVPPILRAMFTIPNSGLENSMACRVYRNLRLGTMEDHTRIKQSGAATTTGSFLPNVRKRSASAAARYYANTASNGSSFVTGMSDQSTTKASVNMHDFPPSTRAFDVQIHKTTDRFIDIESRDTVAQGSSTLQISSSGSFV